MPLARLCNRFGRVRRSIKFPRSYSDSRGAIFVTLLQYIMPDLKAVIPAPNWLFFNVKHARRFRCLPPMKIPQAICYKYQPHRNYRRWESCVNCLEGRLIRHPCHDSRLHTRTPRPRTTAFNDLNFAEVMEGIYRVLGQPYSYLGHGFEKAKSIFRH
jgi:hypothetical protein